MHLIQIAPSLTRLPQSWTVPGRWGRSTQCPRLVIDYQTHGPQMMFAPELDYYLLLKFFIPLTSLSDLYALCTIYFLALYNLCPIYCTFRPLSLDILPKPYIWSKEVEISLRSALAQRSAGSPSQTPRDACAHLWRNRDLRDPQNRLKICPKLSKATLDEIMQIYSGASRVAFTTMGIVIQVNPLPARPHPVSTDHVPLALTDDREIWEAWDRLVGMEPALRS
jgi:hypothetical protein